MEWYHCCCWSFLSLNWAKIKVLFFVWVNKLHHICRRNPAWFYCLSIFCYSPILQHQLTTIVLDSLWQQEIIVDAIGSAWVEENENNRLDSPRERNGHDNNHENSTDARLTTNNPQHQQQKALLFVRIIDHIVNATEGSLFPFQYKILERRNWT